MIRRVLFFALLLLCASFAGAQSAITILNTNITTAVTGVPTSPVMLGRLPADAARYLAAQAVFTHSYGGTNATAYLQTSLDGGTTWIDIMSFQFTTSTATKASSVHIAPATPLAVITPTDGSLSANTVQNGIIGDRLRVKLTTTGTYAPDPATNTVVYTDVDVTASKVVVVDGVTYTFVASVASAGDVKVAGTSDASWTNLSRCINKSGGTEGAGQDYMSAGGVAHPRVSSAINTTGTGGTVTLTALTGGTAGNAYTLTSDEATATLGGATFSNGTDDVTNLKVTVVPR